MIQLSLVRDRCKIKDMKHASKNIWNLEASRCASFCLIYLQNFSSAFKNCWTWRRRAVTRAIIHQSNLIMPGASDRGKVCGKFGERILRDTMRVSHITYSTLAQR